MKRHAMVLVGAILLAGCDLTSALEPVNPVLAGLSNIFGFDALRGKIKHFTQTQTDDAGKVTAYVEGAFDAEGCLVTLRTYQPAMNLDLDLLRDGNRLIEKSDRQVLFQLTEHCQLEKTPDGRLSYRSDDKQAISEVVYRDRPTPLASYRYDDEGFPISMTFVSPENGKVTTVEMQNDAPAEKRLNATVIVTENNQQISVTRTTCQYDQHFNPRQCQVLVSNGKGVTQTVTTLTHTTKIEYY
ncbi:YnfC family lipoprotein [Dickeya chrysanthemi]|uniref:YnfC family lipoprotein n=1 Tax=Dickeya chrysanthemi TaxID=556 RepID=UPI0003A39379|nr:YnfC family lipoprotein [Dickeya chrysanthemi]MBX9447633.1 YnfC family lipoprotein [Dickeya chrysanthemi]